MNGKSHEEIKEMLYDYAQGKLDSSDSETVRAHLRECSECATELEEIRETSQLLSQTYGRPAPDNLRSGVMDEISRYEAASKKRKRTYAFMRYGSLAASFAVIILVAYLVMPAVMDSVSLPGNEGGNVIQNGNAYDEGVDCGGMLDQGGWDQDEYPEEEAPGFSVPEEDPSDNGPSDTSSDTLNTQESCSDASPSLPDSAGAEYLFTCFLTDDDKKSEFLSRPELVFEYVEREVCVFRDTEALQKYVNEKSLLISSNAHKDTIKEVRQKLDLIPGLTEASFIVVFFK